MLQIAAQRMGHVPSHTLQIDSAGTDKVIAHAPGDGTVPRSSALMREADPDRGGPRLNSPIGWDQVLFLFTDHLDLTRDPAFTDNVLYWLLVDPTGR